MIPRTLLAALLISILACGHPAFGQSAIELRSSARLTPGKDLVLTDVARLTGADAEAFAHSVIAKAEPAPAPRTLTLDAVRAALESGGRVNWGRIELRGSACQLLAPIAAPTAAPSAAPAPTPVEDEPAPTSVKAAVIARIVQLTQAPRDDLRLTFSPEDRDLLALSTVGRTLEIRPTAVSDRLPLAITVFEGDRILASKSIRVGVLVRRTVFVASEAKRRGDALAPDDYTQETQWVAPTVRPVAPEQLVGAASKGKITPGDVIMADDVMPAIIVSKGEIVAVRCLSGAVSITTRGRAVSAARDGEIVQFQALDSKRLFYARMDGRGRAVAVAGMTPDPSSPNPRAAEPQIPASLPVRGDRVPAPRPDALEFTR